MLKKCDHGCKDRYEVINREHFEPSQVGHLMMHRACRHDQPVLKVLCGKALENEHFTKVPVKRELGRPLTH
jgi:hypothetical protein